MQHLKYVSISLHRALLPQSELRYSVVLGRRYTGEEARAAGIVDEVCPLAQLKSVAMAAAVRLAGKDGLDRKTLSAIKHDLYRDVVRVLSEPTRTYSLL